MTAIFHDGIGKFIYIYMDDLFVYDDTISNHEIHLEFTLQKLHKNHLFLEEAKCNLFSSNMDCLGHLIDD
jgi:hypothetical protein